MAVSDFLPQGTQLKGASSFLPQNNKLVGASSFLPGTKQKTDLTTSTGLYNYAAQSGLQGEADRILKSQQGEDAKKIFSGGFISDIFDVLNVFQYGIVGVMKGKSFAEGVRTRQSFSDKDALGDNGIPGVIAGIAMDIAVDPLTYLPPLAILKRIPGLVKGAKILKNKVFGKMVPKAIKTAAGTKAIQQLEGGSKIGRYMADKLKWMFGADPIFKETWERGVKNIAVGVQNVADIPNGVVNLGSDVANKAIRLDKAAFKGGVRRNIRLTDLELQKVMKGNDYLTIKKANDTINELGRQHVKHGILSKEVFDKSFEKHLSNKYLLYETPLKKSPWLASKLGVRGTKKRVAELTAKRAGEIGQIQDAGYLYFKTIVGMKKDLETAKLFSAVNKSWASDVVQEGFKKLPKTLRLGELSEQFVSQDMYKYIQEIAEPVKYTMGKKLVANFKFAKVIMNPATHARNIVSNKILNWWKLGMNPLDPRTMIAEKTSVGEIFRKGGKWIKRAKKQGYNLDTMASNEIIDLAGDPQVLKFAKGFKGKIGRFKKTLGGVYQAEENQAKLAAFIFNSKFKGMTDELAWKAAESATFNYAQVTPFVRKLRTSLFGFPFITFTTKATPVAIETALKHTGRISVFGKVKNAIENLSDPEELARERASEPPWVRDGFYIKLPIKDKNGRSAYFDLTYILPFGDLMSGQFFDRQTSRTTGAPESIAEAALRKSPTINFIREISKNQDFYGNRIWRESDTSEKQLGDLFMHFTKTMTPPLVGDQLPAGYNKAGERQWRGLVSTATRPTEDIKQKRTLMQELLRQVGAKVQPIDVDIQETYAEWNKKKALQSLLAERGVLKEFSRSYIPKD